MKVEMGKAQPEFNSVIQASASPTTGRHRSPRRDPSDPALESDDEVQHSARVEDGCDKQTVSAEHAVAVVLSDGCRTVRRQLPALAWMILEQVALDAVLDEGRLLARTSARQIAEQLAVNPGTATRALRLLRDRGLLVLHRDPGPAGRFGLSVYALNAVDGLTVRRSDTNLSCTVHPSNVPPHVTDPHTVTALLAPPHMQEPSVVQPQTDRGRPRARHDSPAPASRQGGVQPTLDLGLESA